MSNNDRNVARLNRLFHLQNEIFSRIIIRTRFNTCNIVDANKTSARAFSILVQSSKHLDIFMVIITVKTGYQKEMLAF